MTAETSKIDVIAAVQYTSPQEATPISDCRLNALSLLCHVISVRISATSPSPFSSPSSYPAPFTPPSPQTPLTLPTASNRLQTPLLSPTPSKPPSHHQTTSSTHNNHAPPLLLPLPRTRPFPAKPQPRRHRRPAFAPAALHILGRPERRRAAAACGDVGAGGGV